MFKLRKKILLTLSFVTTNSIIIISAGCISKADRDQFILNRNKVNFDRNHIYEYNPEQPENKTIDKWSFRLVFPNKDRLLEEINLIKEAVKKDSKLVNDYEWIKDLVNDKINNNLIKNFNIDYLWGRGLIGVQYGSEILKNDISISLDKVTDDFSYTKCNFVFVVQSNKYEQMKTNRSETNYDTSFLKKIEPNHNHITSDIVKNLNKDLQKLLKYNK